MGRLKAVRRRSAMEKWIAESAQWEKYRTETLERIERILAREETGK